MTVSPLARTIGYLRVSTGEQELQKNEADILRLADHYGLGRVQFVEEKASGKTPWRDRKIGGAGNAGDRGCAHRQ